MISGFFPPYLEGPSKVTALMSILWMLMIFSRYLRLSSWQSSRVPSRYLWDRNVYRGMSGDKIGLIQGLSMSAAILWCFGTWAASFPIVPIHHSTQFATKRLSGMSLHQKQRLFALLADAICRFKIAGEIVTKKAWSNHLPSRPSPFVLSSHSPLSSLGKREFSMIVYNRY